MATKYGGYNWKTNQHIKKKKKKNQTKNQQIRLKYRYLGTKQKWEANQNRIKLFNKLLR